MARSTGGGGDVVRNFPQFFALFVFEETQNHSEPVHYCCCLTLRGGLVVAPQFFRNFPALVPQVFAIFWHFFAIGLEPP